jgi:catechol 2,3-dioxygenase-like lactoylglutathione lyase family enzyme
VRFSKDKTPYKNHIDMWFWQGERKGWETPGYFMRLEAHQWAIGAGMHHLCLEVEDIDAVIARLIAHEVELINETPRTRPDGRRYAFVHPSSTGGVLLELYEAK